MTDRYLHASDLQLTNWQGQEINDTTQVFDPGVDENDDYFVNYPAGELPGVEVPVGDVNENPCAEYPAENNLGVDVKLGNAKLPGVDTDFDAKPTGVEMDSGVYGGEAYDAVPRYMAPDNKIPLKR